VVVGIVDVETVVVLELVVVDIPLVINRVLVSDGTGLPSPFASPAKALKVHTP